MTTSVNPILPPTALLRPQMPGVYQRQMIYDPTWSDPLYAQYLGQRIVPCPGSVVKDTDNTPLWVNSVDPVTFVPSYTAIPLSTENENVVSLLNYGNTVFRLYTDYRKQPYPAAPDSKCIFIGKSPRFYTLVRYPRTNRESVISQHYDSTGKLLSQMIPLVALNANKNSWYLPRCHITEILDDNEEIAVRVYSEDGLEVYSALLHTTQSAVVNEDVLYSPTIVGMTVSSVQQLANGTAYLYEKQDFDALGLQAQLVYDDGSIANVPLDGTKCILYGHEDFISSFAGLKQFVSVKYFRSKGENIAPGLADPTGQMITTKLPVTVIPNILAATNKILVIPKYNASLARYVLYHWMYFADGRGFVDVTAYITYNINSIVFDSSRFGISQTFVISVDMSKVDPVNYPTSAIYQQTVVATFYPPNGLVKWTLKDAASSPYILGQDNVSSRRPVMKYDATREQYFIPTSVFGNVAAFINSFYTQAAPPYDPSVAEIPQVPTHFVVRNMLNGAMLTSAPIPIDQYGTAFNLTASPKNLYSGISVVVEFVNKINATKTNILFACPVDVTPGTYLG